MTYFVETKYVQQATVDQEHSYRKWGIVSSLGSQTVLEQDQGPVSVSCLE